MAKATSWIRPGLHTVTPRLIFKDAKKAVEFYEKAFGAKKRMLSTGPEGDKILHGEIQIGDSVIYVVDEIPKMNCVSPESAGINGGSLALSIENVDAVFKKAVDAGCQVKMPIADMFWGDRYGVVTDPFGYTWEMSTHIEDLTEVEIQERAKEAFSKMAAKAR